jgi:hypothetical protein
MSVTLISALDNAGLINGNASSEELSLASNVIDQPSPSNGTAPSTSQQLESPAFSELLHPTVLWRQLKDEIIFSVQLQDIKKYSLEVRNKKTVSFRSIDPPGYGFDLALFGRVCSHTEFVYGHYMKIRFTKRMTTVMWPQILEENGKHTWFKQDIDYASSDEDGKKKSVSKPRKISKKKKHEDVQFESSSEGDSDDSCGLDDMAVDCAALDEDE